MLKSIGGKYFYVFTLFMWANGIHNTDVSQNLKNHNSDFISIYQPNVPTDTTGRGTSVKLKLNYPINGTITLKIKSPDDRFVAVNQDEIQFNEQDWGELKEVQIQGVKTKEYSLSQAYFIVLTLDDRQSTDRSIPRKRFVYELKNKPIKISHKNLNYIGIVTEIEKKTFSSVVDAVISMQLASKPSSPVTVRLISLSSDLGQPEQDRIIFEGDPEKHKQRIRILKNKNRKGNGRYKILAEVDQFDTKSTNFYSKMPSKTIEIPFEDHNQLSVLKTWPVDNAVGVRSLSSMKVFFNSRLRGVPRLSADRRLCDSQVFIVRKVEDKLCFPLSSIEILSSGRGVKLIMQSPLPEATKVEVVARVKISSVDATELPADTTLMTFETAGKIVSCKELPSLNRMVAITFGQSNAANEGEGLRQASKNVFTVIKDDRCTLASDPLPGASGQKGSVWTRLGDKLIQQGLFDSVIFSSIGVGGTSIESWSQRTPLYLRLAKTVEKLALAGIPVTHFLFHQGEADAQIQNSGMAYETHLRSMINGIRLLAPDANLFISKATVCGNFPYETVRQVQEAVVDPSNRIFQGPDTDTLDFSYRYDNCHMNETGLDEHAKLWVDALRKSMKVQK